MQVVRALKMLPIPISAVLLLLVAVGALRAQETAGSISGTVTDVSGAAIPGAAVTVTNQETNVTSTVTTNGSGFYSAEALYFGTYTVRISKAGFKDGVTKGLLLDPGQSLANNVQLQVGSASLQVTVTANAAKINLETSESSATITSKQIDNLMLNGRNFETLAIMTPGVSSVIGADSISGTNANTDLIVNGQSTEYTTYSIDGIYDMNSGSLAGLDLIPIVDGISEFRVLKDNYSAKYGFAGNGQIIVNTKSGTNTFHGTAWEYFRNDALDSTNYFDTTKQALHQNIYGFSLGGPVMIPKLYNTDRSKKTFFFAAMQWFAIDTGVIELGSMFPEAMRQGNFTASPTLTGNLTLDAHSAALLAATGRTNCVTGPKTLNTACFDPTAVAIMNQYSPLPNDVANGFLNYINTGTMPTRQTDYQFRVDQAITPKNELSARMLYQPETNFYPYGAFNSDPASTITNGNPIVAWNNLVRLISTITPNLVNTVGVADTEDRGARTLTSGGTMPAGASIVQSFPGADPYNRIPNISLSEGWTGYGTGDGDPLSYSDGEGLATDDIVWVKGNHVLQAGAVYMFGIKRQTVFQYPQGNFTFSGVHTGDPAADYLLGVNATYSQASALRHADVHYRQGEAYFQDDWKASRRLTVNMGLRWQYFSNDTASGDEVTTFDPATFDPAEAPVVNINGSFSINSSNQPITSSGAVANTLNGLVYAGKNGFSSGFFDPSKKNFGPRIGFAYDLFGDGRSSLHGGYGIGYSRVPVEQVYDAYGANPPYNLTSNILNSLLENATAGTSAAPTPQGLSPVPLSFVPSQIQSYSLTLEHEIGRNTVVTLAYAGSQGRHLMTFQGGYDQNEPLPVSAPSTSGCLPAGQVPSSSYNFDPCINAGIASPNYTRPYAGYGEMESQYDEGGSNYNSLQSGLTFTSGSSRFNLAYTYGKVLTTVGSTATASATSQGSTAQNSRDFAAEYGPPSYDFTNNVTGTWVYAIPYFDHANNKLVGAVLGKWSLAGLGVHQSGYALSPGMSTKTNGDATRPNLVAPFHRVGQREEWFSTTSFAAPAYGFFGDASNGTIRGPGYTSFNVDIYKTFPVTKRFNFQFRAEAFNVANHPNFENVSTSLGAANFGQLTSAGDPRQLEFSIKLIY